MAREYKDSGIEWIGRIPQDWKVCKLSYIYKFQTGATPPTNVESYFNGDIKWANISDLGARTIFDTSKKLSSSGVNKCSMNISPKGSLMYSFKLSVGTVSFCGDDMYTNEAIATFLEGHGYLPYLYYMAPIAIIHNANFNIYGAPLLNQELIRGAKIIVPPLAEQQAIASYLDTKCAEIDSLIELQEQMIAQLTDYKQSVITEAVTKGLNPKVPMKDSGMPWIGQVPAHWEIRKIKNICKSEKYSIKTGPFGTQLKGQELQPEGDVCVYNQRNVIDGQFDETQFFVSSNKAKELTSFYTKPLDLLVTSRGTIGRCAILPKDRPMGILHPCLIALRINQQICNIMWAKIFINDSACFSTNIFLNSNATTIEVIYTDSLKNILIPIPPLEEQQAIITYLDAQCHEIDSLIALKRQKIETLKEYKKSVIFEAVTGKTNID